MNQYIFRGKRKDGQGWVEGDLVRYWAYGVLYTVRMVLAEGRI